jgi:peptidoglycan/xylan/chitin deacetylase (PgdA/CDA1 family)
MASVLLKDMRPFLIACVFAGCAPLPLEPLQLRTVTPSVGSVAGGTRVVLEGAGFDGSTVVEIGGVPCGDVTARGGTLECTTGSTEFVEGVMDVVVKRGGEQLALPAAFEYRCPWTTSTGRRSCGAAPPRMLEEQPIAAWVNDGTGLAADGHGPSNTEDTTDFMTGQMAAWVETDGAGTPRMLSTSIPATDMRGHLIKLWVKVDRVAAASAIEVWLGDRGLANSFRFRVRSSQAQQWMTDGDWVAYTVSWSPDNVVIEGSPDRSAIEQIAFRVVDDATGQRVKMHVNGLALVPEPVTDYPDGVLSFTFDDNWSSMGAAGARVLDRHAFPDTAYIIVDYVDQPDRTSMTELRELQERGWDIAAHAYSSLNHNARFPTLPAEAVEDDLVDSRAWLMTNRFRGHDHCAYPGGDFSYGGDDILPLAARYFTSCRTIYQRQREASPPSDPLKLRVLYVTSGTSLATAEAAVTNAKQNREWIILVFHKLVDGNPSLLTEWRTSDFERLAEHVAKTGIQVRTVAGVLD